MPRRKPLYSLYNQVVPLIPSRSALFILSVDLVPYLIGKLEVMRRSPTWLEGENEVLGDTLLGEQIMSLIQPVVGIDNLYRLIDTTFNGTPYTIEVISGVDTIVPEIPLTPPFSIAPVVPTLLRVREILAMLVTGTAASEELNDTMTLEARLQEVIDAIDSGDVDTAEIISNLVSIVALLV